MTAARSPLAVFISSRTPPAACLVPPDQLQDSLSTALGSCLAVTTTRAYSQTCHSATALGMSSNPGIAITSVSWVHRSTVPVLMMPPGACSQLLRRVKAPFLVLRRYSASMSP